MKKKLFVVLFLIIIILTGISYVAFKQIDKKSCNKYFTEDYVSHIAIKISTNLSENDKWNNNELNETGILIVDTTYNNAVGKKDNHFKVIEYEFVYDSLNYFKIYRTKIISNKQYEDINNKLNEINHYYEPIKTPGYRVTMPNDDNFTIAKYDFDIESIF